MNIVTRAEWGARAPSGTINMTTWGSRTDFVVHYSAVNKYQTVRAIQDYQMDSNGWSDIGYNFLVDYKGTPYEGRKGTWLAIGAHATGQNTKAIGVCCIGTNADITEAQKRTVRWLYDEACRHKGGTLAKRYHSFYANNPSPGDNNTSCPGDNLRNWVKAGMPTTTTEEDEMELADVVHLNTGGEVQYSAGTTTVEGVLASTNYYTVLVRNLLIAQRNEINDLQAQVADIKTALANQAPQVNITAADVARALIDELRA